MKKSVHCPTTPLSHLSLPSVNSSTTKSPEIETYRRFMGFPHHNYQPTQYQWNILLHSFYMLEQDSNPGLPELINA